MNSIAIVLTLIALPLQQEKSGQEKIPLDEISVERVTMVKVFFANAQDKQQGLLIEIRGRLKFTENTLSELARTQAIPKELTLHARLDNQPLKSWGEATGWTALTEIDPAATKALGLPIVERDKYLFAALFYVEGSGPERDVDLTTSVSLDGELAVTSTSLRAQDFRRASETMAFVRIKEGREDREDKESGEKKSFYCITLQVPPAIIQPLVSGNAKLVAAAAAPEFVERDLQNRLVACFDPQKPPKDDAWEIHFAEPSAKIKIRIDHK